MIHLDLTADLSNLTSQIETALEGVKAETVALVSRSEPGEFDGLYFDDEDLSSVTEDDASAVVVTCYMADRTAAEATHFLLDRFEESF